MEFIAVDKHDSSRLLKIGSQLKEELKDQLTDFLRHNLDVFTWTHADMTGISPDVACHILNIDSTKMPVKQKKRRMGAERSVALEEEVKNLLANNFIR